MARVAIGDALGAGFRIIQRRPLVPLVWGLVYFLCAYLPAMLSTALMMPTLTQAMRPGAVVDPSQVMTAMAPMQLMNLLQMAFGLVAFALVNAAVCRAVLEPDNDRAFYLRLGSQELWQGLVLLVIYVLLIAASLAAAIPLVIVGIATVMTTAQGVQGGLAMIPVMILFGLVVLVVIGYLALRLSMALPMSFAHRQFRLFESWSFTKGNTLRLLGLGALIVLVTLMAEILIALVLGAIGMTVFAAGGLGMVQELASQSPAVWLPRLAIWIVPAALVFSAVIGYLLAFCLAPWVEAYRQIAGPNYADVFSDTPAPVTA